MAKPSLKRETIKGIQTENAFNMAKFGDVNELTRKKGIPTQKNGCGTACCVAGHIVAAAKRLGLPMLTPKQADRAAELAEARRFYGKTLTPTQAKLADRCLDDKSAGEEGLEVDDVAVIARDVWASQYGKAAAEKLDFFGRTVTTDLYDLENVTAESAVEHLRTGAPLEVQETENSDF
jgi:hypothetical protein